MRRSGRFALMLCVGALVAARAARADLVSDPPHPHAGANVVTFNDGHAPIATHQHQHRTPHDPRQGVFIEGGTGTGYAAYTAAPPEWVWVGRTLVSTGNLPAAPPPQPPGYSDHGAVPTEWAHGHQGDSPDGTNIQPPARYDVHPAVAGGEISAQEAADWNANALTLAFNAFNGIGAGNGWLDVGNASGINWPATDNTTQAPTGVPWHSGVNWVADAGTGAHELHITYGEAGAGAKGITKGTADPPSPLAGHYAPGSGSMSIIMDDDVNWFFGVDPNPANFPNLDDMQTTMLHEVGHVLGLGHFGTYDRGYIMAERNIAGVTGRGDRSSVGGINYSIDPDAIHGIRDLYAVAVVPEPAGAFVLIGAATIFMRLRSRQPQAVAREQRRLR